MPIGSVKLRPGVEVEATPSLNEAGISASNLIRFREGLAEKYGGWDRYYPFAIGSPVRDLHAWEDLNQNGELGVGAEQSLSIISGGVNNIITPQQTTTNTAPDFSTVSTTPTVTITDSSITPKTSDAVFIVTQVAVGGLILSGMYPIASVTGAHSYTITAASNATGTVSNGGAVPTFTTQSGDSLVSVALTAHGLAVGGSFYIGVQTAVGGVTLTVGSYDVVSVTSANAFKISASTVATSTATVSENGGNVRFLYFITVGPTEAGSGYGVGGYGEGGYGTGVTAPSGSGTPITAADWTLDNWGEILMACPTGGAIYYFQPGSGFRTATVIETGPVVNTGIFVAMPQRQLIAYGSSTNGVQDPLLIRYSDNEDFTVWTANSGNQAGSFRLSTGSRIIGALQAPQQGLIWTDVDLWSMQYIGAPFIYGFNKLMTGCGMIAQHAVGVIGNVVYWMGPGSFYVYSGGGSPQGLPCSVWDTVFQNLDMANSSKIYCGVNSQFDEIAWFFPSITGGTGDNDSCVKYNTREKTWDCSINTFGRSAWIDQSVLGSSIAAGGPTGIIYQHEQGYDADGVPMTPYLETGYFMLSDGWLLSIIDLLWPDFKWGTYSGAQTAQVQLTFYTVDYPGDTPTPHGPYTVTQATKFVNTRGRGRQAKIRIASSDLGSFWRIGDLRFRFAPSGRR